MYVVGALSNREVAASRQTEVHTTGVMIRLNKISDVTRIKRKRVRPWIVL
jgi:hypothetical protein